MRLFMKFGGRLAAGVVLTSLMVGGFLVTTEGAAVAGTNGQEVQIYNYNTSSTSQYICGYNQNTSWVCSSWSPPNPQGSAATLNGWWWKTASGQYGFQYVRIYTNTGGLYFCNVPQSLSGYNVVRCTI
jgi:hypothetical protein